MRIAVCPGSFDPVTNGHLDVIRRACALFDQVHVVVGVNAKKGYLLDVPTRVGLLDAACAGLPVTVAPLDGLLADYVRDVGACAIVKGLRGGADLDYEHPQALMNRELSGADTVFLLANPAMQHLSSSVIKDVALHGGDIDSFVPVGVGRAVTTAQAHGAPGPAQKGEHHG